MDKKTKQCKMLIWGLISFFLFYACSPTSSHPSGTWRVIGVYDEDHSIMTASFLNEQVVTTGGVLGQMAYSSDGAQTWLQTTSNADCRYGMDIVSPQVIWSCGGATNVRKSVDGGRTWSAQAAFGDQGIQGPCHSASFLDETTGWLANSEIFGTTMDGGASWNLRSLPANVQKIATIDTYSPGEGFLLDQRGGLFFTEDDGQHWRAVGQIPMGDLRMSMSAYQLAAMRFTDAKQGLVVISPGDYGNTGKVMAFHTSDARESWTSESVPVPAGSLYLSREGYLTVITAYGQLTLLKYDQ